MHFIGNESTVAKLAIAQPFAAGSMTNDLRVPIETRFRHNAYSMQQSAVPMFETKAVEEMPGYYDSFHFNPNEINDKTNCVPETAIEADSVTLAFGQVSYVATQRVLARMIYEITGVTVRGLRAQVRRDNGLGTGLWFCDVAPCDAAKVLQLHHSALMHHDRVTVFKFTHHKSLRAWATARDQYCAVHKLTNGRATQPLVVEMAKPTRVRGGRKVNMF